MAAVADLVTAMTYDEVEPDRFRFSKVELGERGVVFGGQILAHLIVAAGAADRTGTKRIKSAHGLFARPVLVESPFDVVVDVLHAGRAFASCSATLWQEGRQCARGLVLLHSPEDDLIRHAPPAPDVEGPEEATRFAEPTLGREVRTVGGIDIQDPDLVRPAETFMWVRVEGVPEDPVLNAALLAHSSAGFLIATAMLPHPGVGQGISHREISTGIIGHTVSFHADVDAGDWVLLANESPWTGQGRAFGRGQAFSRDGELVASYSQEAMIRNFPEGQSPEGRESTIL